MWKRRRGGPGGCGRTPRIGRSFPRFPLALRRRNALPLDWTAMGDWYSIGVFAGLGVALGIAAAGAFGGRRFALVAPFLAGAVGVALGIVLADAEEAAAAGVGGVLGAVGALELVRGALGRGGTRLGNRSARPARRRGGRGARVRPRSRLRRGGRPARARNAAPQALGTALRRPALARPGLARREEGRPDRHRRPDAGHARTCGRDGRRARPALPDERGRVPARGHDVPLADAGLPVVDRDRSPPGRARDPTPRLVPPRRGAGGRVRLLVRGDPRGRDDARDPRRRSST